MKTNRGDFRPSNVTGIIGSQATYKNMFADAQPAGRYFILPSGRRVVLSDEEWAAREVSHKRTQNARRGAGAFRVLVLAFVPVACILMLIVARQP